MFGLAPSATGGGPKTPRRAQRALESLRVPQKSAGAKRRDTEHPKPLALYNKEKYFTIIY